MSYSMIRLFHEVSAFAAVGPLLFAPWIVLGLSLDDPSLWGRLAVLRQVEVVWARLGWLLVATGAGLFALSDWQRAVQPWFLLSIGIFLLDMPVERWLRKPAMAQLGAHKEDRREAAVALRHLRLGVGLQSFGIMSIIMLMVGQSVF